MVFNTLISLTSVTGSYVDVCGAFYVEMLSTFHTISIKRQQATTTAKTTQTLSLVLYYKFIYFNQGYQGT